MDGPVGHRYSRRIVRKIYAARFIGRILFCNVIFLLILLPVKVGGTEVSVPRNPIKLVVADFEQLGGDPHLDILERSIPELINVALLPQKRIILLKREPLWRKLIEMRIPQSQMNSRRIFQDDVLEKLEVDYVLTGIFFEIEGVLRLEGVLRNLKTKKKTTIGPVDIPVKDVFPGVGVFALEVLGVLGKEERAAPKQRTFAVLCFRDESPVPTRRSKWSKRDLPAYLSKLSTRLENRNVVEWTMVEEPCESPPNAIEVARNFGVDAVISGFVREEGGELQVQPELYVTAERVRVEMPAVKGSNDRYLEMKIELSMKVMEFLNAVLSDEGMWQVGELVKVDDDFESYVSRGKELAERGDLRLAALFFDKALAMNSSDPEVHYHFGLVRFKQKRFYEAEGEFRRALELKSDYAEAQEALGDTLFRLRQYAQSVQAYKSALQINPDIQGVNNKIGDVYYLQGDYQQAKHYYGESILQNPNDSRGYYRLGVVELVLGDKDEAITWYRKAVEVAPESKDIKKELAQHLHRRGLKARERGDYLQAIADFTEEVELYPTPNGYFERANTYLRSAPAEMAKDYSLPIRDYCQSLRLSDSAPETFANRPYCLINLTEAYILDQNYKRAHSWAKDSLKEFGNEPRFRWTAQFLFVVARILRGKDYEEELGCLRRELKEKKDIIIAREFDLLENNIKESSDIREDRRDLVLQLIHEVQKEIRNR